MKPLSSDFPSETPPAIPRLDSLHHRLLHAKDADGQPIDLLDELLFFLDDPPPNTADRWQQGADLCARHGITTSRMAVWRFYRKHILQWRREQSPPPEIPIDPEEINRLHDQARYLAAQRAIEMLHDPRLSPGHLIGLLQGDIFRQKVQLARDQFNDRVAERRQQQRFEYRKRVDEEARDQQLFPAQMAFLRKYVATLANVPPDAKSPDTTP